MADKIRKIAEEEVFKTKRMRGVKKTFEKDGGVFNHTIIQSAPSVAVIVKKLGKIALIKQFRTTTEQYYWELPAGLVEPGETVEEAAVREVMEETGIIVEDAKIIVKGPSLLDISKSDENSGVAIASAANIAKRKLDAEEVIDDTVVWISEYDIYDRLWNQIKNGEPFYEGLYMSGHSVYALLSAYFLEG